MWGAQSMIAPQPSGSRFHAWVVSSTSAHSSRIWSGMNPRIDRISPSVPARRIRSASTYALT